MNINRRPLKVARFLKLTIRNGNKIVSTITPDDVDQEIIHPDNFLAIVKSTNPYEAITCCLYLDDIIDITHSHGVTYETQ